MNNIAVVYGSKYGTTKKYAQWIAKELNADIFESNKTKISMLEGYNTVVYGGGLYAGGVNGISLITKNFEKLKDKNLILFTCGLADTTNEENIIGIKGFIDKILTTEMKNKFTFFHLRGGIDYKNLTLIHKIMMSIMKRMISKKKPEELSDENKEMLATYGGVVDFTDRSSIIPLVNFVKSI